MTVAGSRAASFPPSVRFGGADTPGLNIAHQFLEKNACRTAKSFADRPDFEQIKYAALGGMIQCENLEEFWPTDASFTREDAEAYFARRREGQGEAGFDLRVLQGETRAMQARLLSDKLSRRFDHFSEFVGPECAWAELESSIFQTVGRGGVAVGDDPRGIDITADGGTLIVASEDSSQVHFIDTATLAASALALPAGASSRDVDINTADTLAFVPSGNIDGDDGVFVLDIAAQEVSNTIIITGASNPNVVAVAPQLVACAD